MRRWARRRRIRGWLTRRSTRGSNLIVRITLNMCRHNVRRSVRLSHWLASFTTTPPSWSGPVPTGQWTTTAMRWLGCGCCRWSEPSGTWRRWAQRPARPIRRLAPAALSAACPPACPPPSSSNHLPFCIANSCCLHYAGRAWGLGGQWSTGGSASAGGAADGRRGRQRPACPSSYQEGSGVGPW